MKRAKKSTGRACPACEKEENQIGFGKNRSGSQRFRCKPCGKTYTPQPNQKAYNEEVRKMATKTYYAGVSGRGVGKIFGMSKANVYNWIKKNGGRPEK